MRTCRGRQEHTHITLDWRGLREQGARRLGIPFGVPCELVTDDSDTVDGTTGLEVLAQLLSCGLVVHLQVERGTDLVHYTHTDMAGTLTFPTYTDLASISAFSSGVGN